jgi:hypothetical protein
VLACARGHACICALARLSAYALLPRVRFWRKVLCLPAACGFPLQKPAARRSSYSRGALCHPRPVAPLVQEKPYVPAPCSRKPQLARQPASTPLARTLTPATLRASFSRKALRPCRPDARPTQQQAPQPAARLAPLCPRRLGRFSREEKLVSPQFGQISSEKSLRSRRPARAPAAARHACYNLLAPPPRNLAFPPPRDENLCPRRPACVLPQESPTSAARAASQSRKPYAAPACHAPCSRRGLRPRQPARLLLARNTASTPPWHASYSSKATPLERYATPLPPGTRLAHQEACVPASRRASYSRETLRPHRPARVRPTRGKPSVSRSRLASQLSPDAGFFSRGRPSTCALLVVVGRLRCDGVRLQLLSLTAAPCRMHRSALGRGTAREALCHGVVSFGPLLLARTRGGDSLALVVFCVRRPTRSRKLAAEWRSG